MQTSESTGPQPSGDVINVRVVIVGGVVNDVLSDRPIKVELVDFDDAETDEEKARLEDLVLDPNFQSYL